MSEPTEKPSELVPIIDNLEIIKFFDEGARTRAGLSVWTKGDETVASCNIISLSQTDKMIYTSALKAPDPKKTHESLKASGEGCFLNMKLERAILFFTSQLQSNSLTTLMFSLPQKLYKVQRRQKQRFKILQGYVLRVSFLDPNDLRIEHKQKVHDISSAGLSFFIDNEVSLNLQPGQTLINMNFTLRNHEFNLAGEIVHCKPVLDHSDPSNPNRFRVGVKFLNISDDATALIDEYVFEETRKFYSRFM